MITRLSGNGPMLYFRPMKDGGSFTHRLRVRSYELDSYNHVNHAVYLNYFETARIEAMRKAGRPFSWFGDNGIQLLIARAEIDYKAPLTLDDEVDITVEVLETGRAKVILGQDMTRVSDGRLMARARLITCCASGGKVIPVPAEFLEIFG